MKAPDKLLCVKCIQDGKRSTVFDRGSSRTLLSVTPYYDEEGNYHLHDGNVHKTVYECSRDHLFEIKQYPPCPNTECTYPDEPKTVRFFERKAV